MKKIKPKLFIQDCGIFSNEILVSMVNDKKKIIAYAKRLKFKKEIIKWLETDNDIYTIKEKNSGLFTYNDEHGVLMLILDNWEDIWTYWETLIHEVSHIVHKVARDKMFLHEDEAKAYLSEYLFRNIRRKIQGVK